METDRSKCYPESPLWNPEIRDSISLEKSQDCEINKILSKFPIPGSDIPLTPQEARIPCILIQQPGEIGTRFGSGWDIIVPAGWGMSFWMNLTFNGGRVGGQREMRHLVLEKGSLDSIKEMPDSNVTKVEMETEKEVLKLVHLR